jgi:2-keto-4-pentenoate hydratase/2-oxohepta-3-ene-1,7-dioic acid hydratase in catechol pathway
MAAFLGNKLVQMGTKIVAVGRNYAAHAKELGSAIPKVMQTKPTIDPIQNLVHFSFMSQSIPGFD